MRSALTDRLKKLREDAGFTLRDAASKLRKSPGYLSRIEGRGEVPSAELLCEMARIYGVDAEELLELAKKTLLEQTRIGIEEKQGEALRLFRKNRKL
jgi:transcriptional regulator with XRE-family HTH domain